MLTDGYTDFISFLVAVATGGILCLIYDFFRILRIAFKSKTITVFFEDLLFFFICGVVTYCVLLLRCSGRLRFFIFAGEVIGFIIIRLTLSRLIVLVFTRVIRWLKEVIFRPFIRIYKKVCAFVDKKIKKVTQIVKKSLQPIMRVLYNKKNNNKEAMPPK